MKKIYYFFIVLIVSLIFHSNGYTATFEIIQITDNSINDINPSLHNGAIAWSGEDENGYFEIFYWNGSTTEKITNDGNIYNVNPSLYNGTIAWNDENGGNEILYWDGNTILQITNNTTNDYKPSLYNGTIAWVASDGNDSEIFYWDGNQIIQVTDNDYNDYNPSLHNGAIAWEGGSFNESEIYYWDGSNIIQITDNSLWDHSPSTYNGTIAWAGFDGSSSEIYYWNGSTIIIIPNSTGGSRPSVYNGTIAWEAVGGNDFLEIYYWDGNITSKVTDNEYNDEKPSLYNNTIAWQGDTHGGDSEIFYANIITTYPPTANAGPDQIVYDSVTLDGSGSYDTDGTIVSFDWLLQHREDSAYNRNDVGVNPTIPDMEIGFYDVTLTVTDDDGLSDTDTMLLAVAGPCGCLASTLHIESIIAETAPAIRNRKYGKVTVTIYDDCGGPVSNASVTGTFTGSYTEQITGTTASDGTVVITTSTYAKKPSYIFCVDDVSHSSLTYDSSGNVETCKSK